MIHYLTVNSDLSWTLFIHNYKICTTTCSALKAFPMLLNEDSLPKLLSTLMAFIFVLRSQLSTALMVKIKLSSKKNTIDSHLLTLIENFIHEYFILQPVKFCAIQ